MTDDEYEALYAKAVETRCQRHTLEQAEVYRLKHSPRPTGDNVVLVGFEDVVQASTFGLISSLNEQDGGDPRAHSAEKDRDDGDGDLGDRAKVNFEDIVSPFLFHCDGFGSVKDVIKRLEGVKPDTKHWEKQSFVNTCHILNLLGFKIHVISSMSHFQSQGEETIRKWFWLKMMTIGEGNFDMSAKVVLPPPLDPTLHKDEMEFTSPPDGVVLDQDDLQGIKMMRRNQASRKHYLHAVAEYIQSNPVCAYISPSTYDLDYLLSLPCPSQEGTGKMVQMILYGGYEWNTHKIDWSLPGPWVCYDDRVRNKWTLGEEYELEMVVLPTWEKIGRWFTELAEAADAAETGEDHRHWQ